MNIAFILDQFPALSETFILRQITGLLDRGHEVDIYAYRPRNDPGVHADVESYNLLKRTYYMTSYTSMPRNKAYRLIKGIGYAALEFRKKPMVVLNSLNILKFGKDAASLELLYRITPFLNKGPYDIVHCHFGPIGHLAVMLKAVGAIRGQIITTFRGYDISSYIKKRGEHAYDTLFNKGNLFLCVSEQIKDTLMTLGCAERKIIVHRSGVHIGKSHLSRTRPKTDGKVRLLTVARLVEKKGIQYGIRSIAKLLKNYPHIEYRIAGDGYLKNTLQLLIEELKLTNHVKLLGWQRQEQIRALLQEADILLAPSVTSQNGDREGIPGAIVEALACGLPILSTRHSGIPEVVQDGESGFLVPERDTDALAEKLAYLIEHPERWPEMGRQGRKYVEEHYDIDRLNDRLVEIYQELLRGQQIQ
jgi:colanic acid/amylovoran/stewartan biosynthesis glycosyltransferase WcaL/AmsK/CpsK